MLVSCGAGQSVSKTSRQMDYSGMATLADALRVQSGLQVVGSANNIKVTIRGGNTGRTSSSSTFTQSATENSIIT